MTDICIIPARGGSKRIKRKNIRNFVGKAMIRYAIEVAQEAKIFAKIIVSTDDDEIARVSSNAGAELPFTRPPEISGDYATTAEVIDHAIDALKLIGSDYENICCIYPCVPFLTPRDILISKNYLAPDKYVFPVQKSVEPFYRGLKIEDGKNLSPIWKRNTDLRTQDLPDVYFDAGQFYWANISTWKNYKNIHQNGIAYVIEPRRFIDIDTQDDWLIAELKYKIMLDNNLKGKS